MILHAHDESIHGYESKWVKTQSESKRQHELILWCTYFASKKSNSFCCFLSYPYNLFGFLLGTFLVLKLILINVRNFSLWGLGICTFNFVTDLFWFFLILKDVFSNSKKFLKTFQEKLWKNFAEKNRIFKKKYPLLFLLMQNWEEEVGFHEDPSRYVVRRQSAMWSAMINQNESVHHMGKTSRSSVRKRIKRNSTIFPSGLKIILRFWNSFILSFVGIIWVCKNSWNFAPFT